VTNGGDLGRMTVGRPSQRIETMHAHIRGNTVPLYHEAQMQMLMSREMPNQFAFSCSETTRCTPCSRARLGELFGSIKLQAKARFSAARWRLRQP
jgi:hypothetical protein